MCCGRSASVGEGGGCAVDNFCAVGSEQLLQQVKGSKNLAAYTKLEIKSERLSGGQLHLHSKLISVS